MADYSLVPVDYQPDFGNVSLVPVDYDPFSADDATQQAQAQAQPAPLQPEGLPQQPATGIGQPNVGTPTIGTQAAAPMQPNPYPAGYPTSNSAYGPSMVNAVRGMFNPSFDEDKKIASGIYAPPKMLSWRLEC